MELLNTHLPQWRKRKQSLQEDLFRIAGRNLLATWVVILFTEQHCSLWSPLLSGDDLGYAGLGF